MPVKDNGVCYFQILSFQVAQLPVNTEGAIHAGVWQYSPNVQQHASVDFNLMSGTNPKISIRA